MAGDRCTVSQMADVIMEGLEGMHSLRRMI